LPDAVQGNKEINHATPATLLPRAWKVFSFLQLNAFLSARGYNFFLGCMYIMAAGLVLNVGLCIWVSKAFAENRFDHVW
jgi:hypothetical protein